MTIGECNASCVVTASNIDQILTLKSNGNCYRFCYVWLLDNCQCGECFHSSTLQRQVEPTLEPLVVVDCTVKCETINVEFQGNQSDRSHSALYPVAWAIERAQAFRVPPQNTCLGYDHTRTQMKAPVLWSGQDSLFSVPSFVFSELSSHHSTYMNFAEVNQL